MTIELFELQQEDVENLTRLHIAAWNETYSSYMPSEVLKGNTFESRLKSWQETLDKKDPSLFVLLAKIDNELAGFVVASIDPRDKLGFDAELMAIYVLKKFHKQGIGKVLMSSAFEFCRTRGAKNIYLWVAAENMKALEFYSKFGGKKESLVKNDHGVRHVCFSWGLAHTKF